MLSETGSAGQDGMLSGKICPFMSSIGQLAACVGSKCELWAKVSWLPAGYDDSLEDEGCAYRMIAEAMGK